MGESGQGHSQSRRGWFTRRRSLVVAALVLVASVATTQAYAGSGGTTLEKTIVQGDEINPGFFELETGPGSELVVRELNADAQDGRKKRRRSLAYFAQLTDFQLADEESPARVEFADDGASSAWRPMEAFHPFAIDMSMRRLNQLDRSPIRQGNGDRAKMRLTVLTGDQADNQQFNETLWVRKLLEPDSRLNPGSGINDVSDYQDCNQATRQAVEAEGYKKEPNYIGVQDYKEFAEDESYYDPDHPQGPEFGNWPRYRGLMDRAQKEFRTTGLKVPSYVVNGNHDSLVQGNEDANRSFEDIAIGCVKVRATTDPPTPGDADNSPSLQDVVDLLPPDLLDLEPPFVTPPAEAKAVPPDPDRRFVSKAEIRRIFEQGNQNDDHGFKFVDPEEDEESGYTAWYYAWEPDSDFRFISIDTVSEGGQVQSSSEGNIDDPQWDWLEDELQDAEDEGKLVVVFGHHPIRSLVSPTRDEEATACAGSYDEDGEYSGPGRDPRPKHNHDTNPGCDPDPRVSTPLHFGEEGEEGADQGLKDLLESHPNVIAYVPGHTHENRVMPCGDDGCETANGFWELNTSAVADWPQQNRLIDVMDNRDGTLSIFSVITDHASNIGIPAEGNAGSFNREQLGALGRTFSFNDPDMDDDADGEDSDRNVELLIADPRGNVTANRDGEPGRNEGEGEGEGEGGGEGEELPAGPTGPTGPVGG